MSLIGTELNVLSIAQDVFLNIPARRKIMLRLFLKSTDQFTLAVWVGKDMDYDSKKPLFFMDIDDLSGYKLKADFALGDQKIGKATIKEVKKVLKKNSTYIVFFKPTNDTDYPNQLAFEILVGDTLSFALTATSFGLTKPSPPYNSKV